ncbi:MAG TPA: alcohol dehydrogenase catalytic domain-containing protein [Gaiellaceae bacterium]|nr:alcohol dehydrogenase catalytic domain-containing protein [Gaiellaceae bacterium]
MKVLRLHRAGDLRLHEEPEPRAADGEVLVHVSAVGLCGSDRHWFVEAGIGDAVLDRPLVLGHEFAGVIASGPRAGERVALDPAVPCRRCDVCLAGLPHLCPSGRFAGHGSTDGALRTSLAWPEDLAHRLPDRVPDTEAALLEPLGVALHSLDLGHVRRGTRTGVFGCGPIGLLLVQAIGAAGGETVVATDPLPHRRTAALTAGAAEAVDPGELAGGGLGLDVAFETAGAEGALADAIEAVRPGGRVVLVGVPDDDRTSFVASAARRKGLTLLVCRRMEPADLPRAIGLAESGGVDLGSLVGERHALDDWRDAFAALVERRTLKVVVEPGR